MTSLLLIACFVVMVLLLAEAMHRAQKHHEEVLGLVEANRPTVTMAHVTGLHDHIETTSRVLAEAMPAPSSDTAVRQALTAFETSHHTLHEQQINGFSVVDTILCKCELCVAARAALA